MIAVVTGGRSDYGILRPLIAKLDDPYVIACGSHSSPTFGNTWEQIRSDGYPAELVEMRVDADTDIAIGMSAGLGVMLMARTLGKLRPDHVLILGDRYEALAAAVAAYTVQVPICHLHGGEVTLGSRDDGHRNAITQLAQTHFVATERAEERVRAMAKGDVYLVGSMGAYNASIAEPRVVEQPFVIATVPTGPEVHANVEEALKRLHLHGPNCISIGPNQDRGYTHYMGVDVETLPPEEFLSLLASARVIVGNSSGGIIEAPSAKTWTVNVGDRQAGRERATSVIDVPNDVDAITHALERTLREDFPKDTVNPYLHGDAAQKMADILSAGAACAR